MILPVLVTALRYLEDRWDDKVASTLDEPELLRYRSNLLGSDLRITNFGGGNTSSKIVEKDPLDGTPQPVLWVKGSGGDLGSIKRSGFATLYLNKLLALAGSYRGVAYEDEMVEMYPLCTFGKNSVAASIDTALHGFLPFAHVDHLHPDWGIALAASANGLEKLAEFNARFARKLVWLPWQRPGFELGMMLRKAVEDNPQCDGVILGGHGLFTWGNTQRECYLNTITIIDQLGQFVQEHVSAKGRADLRRRSLSAAQGSARARNRYLSLSARAGVGGQAHDRNVYRAARSSHLHQLHGCAKICLPGNELSRSLRAHQDPADVRALEPGRRCSEIAQSDRRCPRPISQGLCPLLPAARQAGGSCDARRQPHRSADSRHRDVQLRQEQDRIADYRRILCQCHPRDGGGLGLESGAPPAVLPQAGPAAESALFQVHCNYVALPPSEAFRIEYWALEEAKIRRQPPEKELSRHIVLIVGGGSGIGREVVRLGAGRGAHVVVADRDLEGAAKSAEQVTAGKEFQLAAAVDIRDRTAIRALLRKVVAEFGGLDILVNTAAIFPSSADGHVTDEQWAATLQVNVTANHLLVDEAAKIFAEQALDVSVVLTSSANAVVAKRGSEAYDVSKAAVSHLVREMAVALAPRVRVNGISPATVVKGSTMFPRDRVMASLTKYNLPFERTMTDEELRTLLANFYAQRTLTHQPIDPEDCANAILFLAGPQARCTSGHLIPVDGGLPEAFLR